MRALRRLCLPCRNTRSSSSSSGAPRHLLRVLLRDGLHFCGCLLPEDAALWCARLFNVMILGLGALLANSICPWFLAGKNSPMSRGGELQRDCSLRADVCRLDGGDRPRALPPAANRTKPGSDRVPVTAIAAGKISQIHPDGDFLLTSTASNWVTDAAMPPAESHWARSHSAAATRSDAHARAGAATPVPVARKFHHHKAIKSKSSRRGSLRTILGDGQTPTP